MRFIPQPAARLSVAVVLVGAGVACQFTGCGPLPGAYGPADRIVPVFFATDRARVADEPLAYGPTRSFPESLHLGRIDVRIPERHKIGEVERPTVRTLYVEDEKSHLVIRAATEQTYEEFYADLNRRMNRSQRREAFIFIHGYNVSFQDAVFRTAQIAWDLSFEGAAILYSWPSVGELKGYPDDSNNNEWTIPHLQYFLEDVVHHTGASTIHLIAHSLGNRALTYALNRIADARRIQANRFDQIILAAPDIDASTFRSLAKAVAQNAHRTTIYASSGDLALKASAQYQGAGGEYRRAGDTTPEVLTLPEIDTLDASLVDTSLLGHSYYGNNRSILTDIHELFAQNAPPLNRFGIESVGKPPRQYWRMLK